MAIDSSTGEIVTSGFFEKDCTRTVDLRKYTMDMIKSSINNENYDLSPIKHSGVINLETYDGGGKTPPEESTQPSFLILQEAQEGDADAAGGAAPHTCDDYVETQAIGKTAVDDTPS